MEGLKSTICLASSECDKGSCAELGEVSPLAPGDELVRHPFLGQAQVPIEVLRHNGFQLVQQVVLGLLSAFVECRHDL